MKQNSTRNEIQKLLEQLKDIVTKEDCWSCECLQGFLTQLEVDTAEDISDIIDSLKINAGLVHECLGCNPCPPAEVYTKYLTIKGD